MDWENNKRLGCFLWVLLRAGIFVFVVAVWYSVVRSRGALSFLLANLSGAVLAYLLSNFLYRVLPKSVYIALAICLWVVNAYVVFRLASSM